MSTAVALPDNTAATFATQFFGPGLADDRCTVERYQAMADGDIRRHPDLAPKGGRRTKAVTATAAPPGSAAMTNYSAPACLAVSMTLTAFGLVRRFSRCWNYPK